MWKKYELLSQNRQFLHLNFWDFLGKTGQKFLIVPILTQMLEVHIFFHFLA
jgi:hypothetical protein